MTAPAAPGTGAGPAADWRTLNLAPGGRSLIEASAGTGKTWTIAVLYLRLLLERGLSPRQIVVTTFTEAAAQELRERLRGRLEWALLQADGDARPESGSTPDAAWLQARWGGADAEACRSSDFDRLRLALAELDVAPVNTLHGLCRRVLADHPFACGVAFVPGDMVAGETLLAEVAEDLWRRLQQGDDTDALVALQRSVVPDLSLRELANGLALCLQPGVAVEAATPVRFEELLPTAWAARLRHLVAREELFRQGSVLRRTWEGLALCIEGQGALPDRKLIEVLHGASELKGVLKRGLDDAEVIAAAGFSIQAAAALETLREQALRDFWNQASAFVRHEMHARLQLRRQMTFDALLGTVSDALQRDAAASAARPLADALFAAWPVALVDEFQDTDGQQYGILDAIYRDAAGGKRGRLVMIGDPKQAIYRFRGGDIHAYRRAAAQVDADGRLTLDVNHRSSTALVEAFNQFYEHGGVVLGADEDAGEAIRYRRVQASDRRAAEPYTVAGQACAQPLQIHYLAAAPVVAPERCALALRVCANQIAGLLQSGQHRIGGRLVAPSDIAVLLPTGRNISDLRDLLAARGVPCASSSRSSVFQGDLARELQVVLYAVAHDDDLPALRAATATRLWGDRYGQLRQRADDVASWQPVLHVFRQWHGLWRERGVQAVVDGLMAHMAPRFLQTLGGERALTDLRHLGELLQVQSEDVAGVEELLAWFTACREEALAAGDDAAEAAQLRIESDHARVQLLTLHASKGLEFPLVFLPLMWNHGERLGAGMHVVGDAAGCRHIGYSVAAKDSEARDLQDERFRVLYVALTRAIYACHVFALPPGRPANGKSDKPAAGTARSALDVMLARAQPPLPADGGWPGELVAATPRLRWIEGWEPAAQRDFRAAAGGDEARTARALPPPRGGPLEARHSFTTLVRGEAHDASDPGAAAGDESDPEMAALLDDVAVSAPAEGPVTAPQPELLALATVRGTDIGNAIHAVFEHRAVGVPLGEQHELIERCLDDAGVRRPGIGLSALVEALTQRLQSAVEAPLGLRDAPALRLADLAAVDLRPETEFTFALGAVAMAALQEACARHGEPDIVPHSTRVLGGLMNGKIDLLFQHDGRFHVLDYKGNYLGDTLEAYQGEALRSSMDRHRYRFQALIYTVAADRYLRQRLGSAYRRDQHLGECVYLFVRAAGLAPDAGIWRHRFPDALLTAVGEVLDTPDQAGEAA